MSTILIVYLDWRNSLLFSQVCSVPWGKVVLYNKPVSVLGTCFRFISPLCLPRNPMSEGFYKWGNWRLEKLATWQMLHSYRVLELELKSQLGPSTSTFSFIILPTDYGWKWNSPAREHVCVHVTRGQLGKGELPSDWCEMISHCSFDLHFSND